MNSNLEYADKDQQAPTGAGTGERRPQVYWAPLSQSEVERVLCACFEIPDQAQQGGNRGEQE